MVKISYTEIRPKKIILLDGDVYEVVDSQVTKKSRQKASNQTKLKNLKTGSVIQKSFHAKDNVEEADLDKKKLVFVYRKKDEVCLRDVADRSNRTMLSANQVRGVEFMKDGMVVDVVLIDEEILYVNPPVKVELAVVEAPPSEKGNTAQGGVKRVTLETGMVISVPLFINVGDVLVINTEKGEYVERAK